MRLPVIFINRRISSLNYDPLPTLIEYLCHACYEPVTIQRFVETDADKTRREFRRISNKAPRNPAGFVIKSRVKIPSSRCLILKWTVGETFISFSGSSPAPERIWTNHLNGSFQSHSSRFEKIVKIRLL